MELPTFKYDRTWIYHLNSANRLSGTDGDFRIKIDITNGLDIKDFDSVCLLNASIPKSYYAIQEGSNQITLRELGVDTLIDIPPETYSATTLAKLMGELLTSNSNPNWNYTCSIDITTAKFTWVVTGNGGNLPQLFPDELYERLGFDKNVNPIFNNSSKLTSSNVVNMSPEDDLFIRSNIVAGGSDSNQDIFFDVQAANVPPFGRIQVEDSDPEEYSKVLNNTTDIFHFFITDEFGTKIILNGINWTGTLLFYKKSSLPDKINNIIKLIAEFM